jgi:hypothetical protein
MAIKKSQGQSLEQIYDTRRYHKSIWFPHLNINQETPEYLRDVSRSMTSCQLPSEAREKACGEPVIYIMDDSDKGCHIALYRGQTSGCYDMI